MARMRALRLAFAVCGCIAVGVGGCGGGGGGPTADIVGRILLTTTGQPPNPAATVTVAGAPSVATGVDGSFTIRSAPASATQITVSAAGMTTLRQQLPALTPNAVNDLGDIFLTDATYNAEVTGVAVRADTLAAVAGAVVVISGLRTVTDAAGRFSLTGLPVGLGGSTQPVGKITAAGLEPKELVLDLPLGSGMNDLGEILLSPPAGGIPGGPFTIGGKVTLQGQTAHAGTTVTLVRASDGVELGSVVTNDAGSFGFWVPVGAYRVRASRSGYVTQISDANLVRLDQPVIMNMTLVPSP